MLRVENGSLKKGSYSAVRGRSSSAGPRKDVVVGKFHLPPTTGQKSRRSLVHGIERRNRTLSTNSGWRRYCILPFRTIILIQLYCFLKEQFIHLSNPQIFLLLFAE